MPSGAGKIAYYLKNGEWRFLLNYVKNKGFRKSGEMFLDILKEALTERNYYESLRDEVENYQSSHPEEFRKAAAHMMFWNLREVLKGDGTKGVEKFELPQDKINVMILPNGGLGEYIVSANYVYFFREKFKDLPMHIDIVSKENFFGPTKSVFVADGESPVDGIYPNSHRQYAARYDLVVDLSRYPVILRVDYRRIMDIDYRILEYVSVVNRFGKENHDLIFRRPFFDGDGVKMCIAEGRTRIRQPDVYDYLGVTEEYHYPMHVPDKEEVLTRLGVDHDTFITVHRGCDTDYSKDSTKLWPVEKYQELIGMIRERYPGLQIVQMGVSHARCVSFEGIDVNVIEKTSIEDLKILLKYSKLHIDCEGGMVHMRHAMHGGPSIVMFGPTPVDFYKYSENYNVTSNGCPKWCEWASSDWTEKCVDGHKEPPCMYSITPESVMEKVVEVLH